MTVSIADRLELSGLVHRYAAYADARRFDDIAELFTAAGELVVPDPPESLGPSVRHDGRAELRAAMAPLGGTIRTHHAIVGEVYDDAAVNDAATGQITAVAHHWTECDGRFTDLVWYLHYADEYLRTEKGWRIARRALSIDAIESRTANRVRR